MITEIKGDITKFDEAQYICHQCNCVTSNSAHLAATMFCAFPWADIYLERKGKEIDYRDLPEGGKPGEIIVRGDGEEERYVINMLGQVFPGSPRYPSSSLDGTDARLTFFKSCISKIARIDNVESIAFPHSVGCGAAGGDWDDYYACIVRLDEYWKSKGKDVDVYIVNYNE